MAEGGGATPPPGAPPPPKRGLGWRLWAILAVVVIVIIAAVAYIVMQPPASTTPTRDTTTIVYYMQSEPVTMDPSDAYDLWSFVALQNTYDTLLGYNKDTTQLVPDLATEVPTVANGGISASGLNVTFHIRTGAGFCDGNNLTAYDVYASFRKILVEASPESGVAWIVNQTLDPTNIAGSLWVKDAQTIQMNLSNPSLGGNPYAAFLSTLATVEPAAIMEGSWITNHGGVQFLVPNPYIKQNTMGTGPYCLQASDWVKGSQMTLRQNKYYWRGWDGTQPTTIVMKFTTDPTSRVEAIRSGAADVADLPLSMVSQVSSQAGVVAKANSTVKSEIIALNTTSPYMANNASGQKVRQAFSYAFDYNATIAQDYAGFAALLPGPIPAGMPFFNVEHQFYYQNIAKANQLLDAAGYNWTTGGYRFGGYAFRIVADGSQLEEANAARRWQNTLALVGVKTNLIIEPSTDAWDTARSSGNFDFFVAHWVLDYLDPDDYVTPMVMSASLGGDYWHTGWQNTTEDTYGLAARSELTSAARASDYTQVYNTAMANPNMIWFCQQSYVPIYQSYIKGFFFNPVTWYNFYFYQKT